MVVERERDEGEAMAVNGPRQEGEAEDAAAAAATGEKGEEERDAREREDGEEKKTKEEEEDEEVVEEKKDKVELQEWSELRLAIAELSPISRRGGQGKLLCSSPPTLPFLGLSHLLLRLLDKIGPTMAVLRLDVQRNIERLQELYLQDPSKYSTLTVMVEKEADEGTVRKADSCARAVLWLTRSMDFTVALLQRLEEEEEEEDEGSDQQQSLAQLVEAAYMVSLKPWHGWISSAACKIALKLIPERKIFVGWLMGENQNNPNVLKDEIEKLVQLLQPFLDDIHAMLGKFRLDRLKST